MVTKHLNSQVKKDMAFGQRVMISTTPDADCKEDTDHSIGEFHIAWRCRRYNITTFGEISIRYERRNGAKTEYQKLLDGDALPHLFVFEFLDVFIVCSGPTLLKALKDDVGYIGNWNKDGETRAYYIPVEKIKHVRLPRRLVWTNLPA